MQSPTVLEDFDPNGKCVRLVEQLKLRFKDETRTVAVPVTAEVYVSRVLDTARSLARARTS